MRKWNNDHRYFAAFAERFGASWLTRTISARRSVVSSMTVP